MAQDIKVWSVYIVESRLGHWYTGITNNVDARVEAHNAGKGAKNLKGKAPIKLIYSKAVGDKSTAAKLEWYLKKLNKFQKIQFVESNGTCANETIKSLIDSTTV
ncbi:GIY-YIG nuclease family protein [Pseudoalteromonas sp. MTN2-4]|uniref:GIY-YIG nuclease family protein n=1 Tax=Pseudoalteromonas sp. MTN2-4 TaxID=3056555 RepID=UPI0036F1F959